MSQDNYIETLLELKGTGIEILTDKPAIKEFHRGHIIKVIFAKLSPTITTCHKCGMIDAPIIKNGSYQSDVRIMTVVGFDTILRLKKQRYLCQACHQTFVASTSLIDQGCCISKPLKMAILLAAQEIISESALARRFNVSHQTVHRIIHQPFFQKHRTNRRLPSYLGFDEFKSVRSAEGAMSFILTDVYHKELIDIVENRQQASLMQYFRRYSEKARRNVKVVTIDMYSPYITVIKQCFPNAEIVIDRFHVVQHIVRAINKIRIRVMKEQPEDSTEYKLLKKYWKQLLQPRAKHDYTHFYCRILQRYINIEDIMAQIETISPELYEHWKFYQDLYWAFKNGEEKIFFDKLKGDTTKLREEMRTVISTLIELEPYIRNCFRTNLNNGVTEGMVQKIKLIIRTSYGYRSFVNLRTRIILCFTLTKKVARFVA